MTDAFLQMPLTQMVDLVINSPEEGIVNFNLLHTVLHVIVKELFAEDVSVELHGSGAQRLQNLINSDAGATVQTLNISVIGGGRNTGSVSGGGAGAGGAGGKTGGKGGGKVSVSATPRTSAVNKPSGGGTAVSKDVKSPEEGGDGTGGKGSGGPTKDVASEVRAEKKDTATETVYVVQPADSTQNFGMTVTKKQLDNINQELATVKEKLQELTELPGNLGIIDAVRTESGGSPVFDMFQILSLSKRVDAAEIGMNKLASIVEDVIRNPAFAGRGGAEDCMRAASVRASRISARASRASKASKASKNYEPQKVVEINAVRVEEEYDKVSKSSTKEEEVVVVENLSARQENVSDMKSGQAIAYLMEEVAAIKEFMEELGFDGEDKMTLAEVFLIAEQIRDKFLNRKTEEECDRDLPADVQLTLLQDRFAEYTKHIDDMDRTFNDELFKLHNQFTDIEKDFNEILLKIQGGLPAGDSNDSTQCCAAVFAKITQLQSEFETITETSSKLIVDKEEKQQKMDLMLEQIELLKTMKADKDSIEEALAEKADACTVFRKVSHDQFDNACDELYKGIEEALSKLAQQEELWQHALDDIQNEIGSKLDKMDLGPLREFINNKLRQLQDKMRSLAALKREQEAAGTKSKLLRDVNCISCDKDVVMQKEMDPSLKPPAYSLPPTRSMAPYLAYELDALRKQQKGIPGGRNMFNLETALWGKGNKKTDDHICNRYCGGSHTVTTPQQRVTRLGHFLLQWGPEAVPKEEVKETAEKEMQTRSPSVLVQGDFASTRKSSTTVVSPSKTGISKTGKQGSKLSISRSATRTSTARPSKAAAKPVAKSPSEEKRVGEKRTSQQSVGSVRSPKTASKVKVVEETIVESPAEEGQGEGAEQATESESTAPPPTRNDEVDAEDEGQGQGQGPPEAAEEAAAAAAGPPADEAPPPAEE